MLKSRTNATSARYFEWIKRQFRINIWVNVNIRYSHFYICNYASTQQCWVSTHKSKSASFRNGKHCDSIQFRHINHFHCLFVLQNACAVSGYILLQKMQNCGWIGFHRNKKNCPARFVFIFLTTLICIIFMILGIVCCISAMKQRHHCSYSFGWRDDCIEKCSINMKIDWICIQWCVVDRFHSWNYKYA